MHNTIFFSSFFLRFPLDQQFLDLRLTNDRNKFEWLRERPAWVPKSSEGVCIIGNNNDQILQVRHILKIQNVSKLKYQFSQKCFHKISPMRYPPPLVIRNFDKNSLVFCLKHTKKFFFA